MFRILYVSKVLLTCTSSTIITPKDNNKALILVPTGTTHNNNNIDFYIVHISEIQINALYNEYS